MKIEIRNKRVEHRDGMGACVEVDVCAVSSTGVVERESICAPLKLNHVDEAWVQREINRYRKQLRDRWGEDPPEFDLDALG